LTQSNIHRWLETATARILFRPDRETVRRELEGHLLDRQERYLARGMAEDEAAKAAVADMGDPEALAVELGRIHRPWWGWLWQASRVLLALCLVFALFAAVSSTATMQGIPPLFARAPEATALDASAVTGPYSWETEILEVCRPEGSTKLGPYRVSAPLAWLEDCRQYDSQGWVTTDTHRLVLCLRFTTGQIWLPGSIYFHQLFIHRDRWAEDSLGQRYSYYQPPPGRLEGEAYSYGLGEVWFKLYLYPRERTMPQWIKVPVGLGGDELTINLVTGGVSR